MRLLHTADLHLGRQFNGISLEQDCSAVLNQIVETAVDNAVDALIVAGDVFDRAIPPTPAVELFNSFLKRVQTETTAVVVIIAGNHDSAARITTMSILADEGRALIRGAVSNVERSLVVKDKYGTVAISALPFCYEYAAQECFVDKNIQSPEGVLRAQVEAARKHLPDGARWVVVAHAFVTGGESSEGEKSLARVGGIETVPLELFNGAHYVALGHLHRPQSVGAKHVRYSGSPLAFGFDEVGHEKSMTIVDMDSAGAVDIRVIPFKPIRGIQVLRGKHAELMLVKSSTDFIKAILTDENPLIDPMKRLREVFPNACQLSFERSTKTAPASLRSSTISKIAEPLAVITDFLEHVRSEGLTESEQRIVSPAIDAISRSESEG